jgi:hypothetical protein
VTLRSFLYAFARLIGNASAIRRGRVGRRVARRAAGKASDRALRRLRR